MTATVRRLTRILVAPACLLTGLAVGLASGTGNASSPAPAPTEHSGLSVDKLGMLPESTIKATTGLDGYFMQLRAITIAPGGQIAKHGHQNRPGLVKVMEGEWIEGRAEGETAYAKAGDGLLEDENTTHWFFNRGSEPATAVVCDLTPVQ